MDNSSEIVEAYYVRTAGRIVGPFTTHVLRTMMERGKLSPYSEVSLNRADWRPLAHLGPQFAAPPEPGVPAGSSNPQGLVLAPLFAPPGAANPPPDTTPVASLALLASAADDVPCFYSIDGQVAGQVPLSYVRELARTGRLSPQDRLWLAGTRDWVDAASVPALAFPTHMDQTMKWSRKSPVLLTCAALLILLLVVGPLVIVFGLAKQRTDQAQEAARIAQEVHERNVRLKKEEVARLEKIGADLATREDRLISQRLQMESNLEQVRLQYTTIAATGIRDERIRGRMDEIEEKIQGVNSQIEALRADQAANAAQQQRAHEERMEAEREGNRLREEGNRTAEETEREVERIRREEEKQTRAMQGR